MVYKLIGVIGLASFLLVGASAQVQAAASLSPQCTTLVGKQQKVNSDIAAKEAPLAQLRVKNTYNTSQFQAIFKTKVTNLRKETDKKIDTTFKKLNTKGESEAQKTALATYETEFRSSLTALRTAQDTTRNDYLAVINNLNATHRATTDSRLVTLKAQIGAAFAAVPIQCQKMGVEKTTAQLVASIKLAQDSYITTPNIGMQSLQPALQTASGNFKAAHDKAATTFKASVQQSRIKLKAAIGETKYIL